ncbi:MAG: ACP phosphodiesterase [Desulfuromonadaceae bacterium]|nr:ACP phosphodiesterase [Geobacteraceae bacterium]
MNYLLHLMFSDPTPDCYAGNLMGDFVKGSLEGHSQRFSAGIIRGLKQHRHIDSYAQRSGVFKQSYRRLDSSYGLYRGIMVDLFYDHFAARNWSRYHPQALPDFAHTIYAILANHPGLVPDFATIVPRMQQHNWLVAYMRIQTIERALNFISQRAKAHDPLQSAITQLERNYEALEQDCLLFIEETLKWIAEERYKSNSPWEQ